MTRNQSRGGRIGPSSFAHVLASRTCAAHDGTVQSRQSDPNRPGVPTRGVRLVTHKDEQPFDPELAELTSTWSEWRFWRSRRSDGQPGAPYASRRRILTPAECSQGLLVLLPHGFAEDDMKALKEQLQKQADIAAKIRGKSETATP